MSTPAKVTTKSNPKVKKRKSEVPPPILKPNDNKVIVLHKPERTESLPKLNETQPDDKSLPKNITVGCSNPFKTLPSERQMAFVCERCNYGTNVEAKYHEHIRAHSDRFICKV